MLDNKDALYSLNKPVYNNNKTFTLIFATEAASEVFTTKWIIKCNLQLPTNVKSIVVYKIRMLQMDAQRHRKALETVKVSFSQ